MAATETVQNYKNHFRFFPLFHFFALPVMLINFLWTLWTLLRTPSGATLWGAIFAAALAAAVLASRVMALAVQDRVIRLEMRLRMRELLPDDLKSRIHELTRQQLVGLRFACDAELPELVRRVLAGSLKTSTDVKKAVQAWEADHLRA